MAPDTGPSVMEQHEITRLRILEAIRDAGSIARKDIAERLVISPATVTSVTADMIDGGLLEEVPAEVRTAATARRGRPRVLLKLNAGACLVAGVKVGRHAITVIISDFEGRSVAGYSMDLDEPAMSPHGFVDNLLKAVHDACGTADLDPARISAVSLGIAGQVDSGRSFVYWSSSLPGRNHDLLPLLQDRFDCPVFIENDANMVAKAEQLFGAGRNLDSFLVVTIEHGIGLGIIQNGKLQRGARGCGAEFGHTKLHYEGALCQCGQRGCLEAYAGSYALIREVSIGDLSNAPSSIAEILERAENGDELARTVLDRAGRMFAMGLANLINLFDPQLIILAGSPDRFDHLHSEPVFAQIRKEVVQVDVPLPEIRVQHGGDMMWSKGAAAHAIEQVSISRIKGLASSAA